MNVDHPFLVRHADIVFALKTFAAAMLALVIALWLDLPRPYWAMATVYITSQPLAGATSSKAFYRVLGTVLGASVTVAMVPNLVNAPELLCLIIALWVGLCLYLSLLDGTPRSYVLMLAGYTVAFIGFPVVSDPASIFDTALARVEEISLGIVCASLVSTVVFPRGVGPAVAVRVDNWLSDARRLSQDVLTGHGTEQASRDLRLRIAADAVEIDTLASHLAYDRTVDIDAARGLRALYLHADAAAAAGIDWRSHRGTRGRTTDNSAGPCASARRSGELGPDRRPRAANSRPAPCGDRRTTAET